MDLIDRQAILKEIREQICTECIWTDPRGCSVCNVWNVIIEIESAPTVEPKRGEWVEPTVEWVDDVKFVLAKCSACGNRAVMDMEQLNDTIKFARNFCGNCGADMRGDNNAE